MGSLAAAIIACSALVAVDGDTIKCDGVRMRLIGDGEPFVSGFDTPEIGKAKCPEEKLLGQKAKVRLQEILRTPGIKIEDSGDKEGLIAVSKGKIEALQGAARSKGCK